MSSPQRMAEQLIRSQPMLRGLEVQEIVSDRRGAAVLRLEREDAAYSLKCAPANTEAAIILANEADFLKHQIKLTNGLYYSSGSTTECEWLCCNWVFGKNAGQTMREKSFIAGVGREEALHLIFLMAQKASEIHRAGFIHGDLQPAHFIINDVNNGRINIIDWALSHRPDNLEFPYKGALYHFVAPEVAKQMCDNKKRVKSDYLSEVYSFGAVVFTVVTGASPIILAGATASENNFHWKLQQVTLGRRHCFQSVGAPNWPDLECILDKAMNLDRGERYSCLDDVISALRKLM